jgi:hypothetical protein
VATTLLHAITPNREVGRVRQGREKIQHPARRGTPHLGPVTPRKGLPRSFVRRPVGSLDERLARGDFRQPHVVKVAFRILSLRHASWRAPDRTNAQALSFRPETPELDDPDGHWFPFLAPPL